MLFQVTKGWWAFDFNNTHYLVKHILTLAMFTCFDFSQNKN